MGQEEVFSNIAATISWEESAVPLEECLSMSNITR
eukprot:CAMPEP_0201881432 /NCGR_PEP_ID=MMETSP0902-20130614/11743_1 /ASSEMBLY_ACC=CAM_ASM_000551 /TAXON_ID=420261 /ORGANISM="Thalassiosira antarctica, Strain CCMP982" /LENGTH=34 /DNA_ID= /DNA_START= /DNA_END= /DNA_ORIENTATION=